MRPRLSSNRDPVIAARLGLAASLSMFGLIVLGSVVRTTGSGLACPDWPTCYGTLMPKMVPPVGWIASEPFSVASTADPLHEKPL